MSGAYIELLLVILGVFIVPLVLGHFISRAVRMPDHGWKIATIFFTVFAAAAIITYGWPPKLGIDLSGGSILVYEVDQEAKDPDVEISMEALIAAVKKRVDPSGVREVSIRPYGEEQIEVIIPRADASDLEEIKEKISKTGMLEFQITANEKDHADLIEQAKKLDPSVRQVVVQNPNGTREIVARWVPQYINPETGTGDFDTDRGDYITRKGANDVLEVLVVTDDHNVTGGDLRSASPGVGREGPQVDFVFRAEGARKFAALTRENLPDAGLQPFHRHLGIVLDGYIHSAPRIITVIEDRGQISGNFTPKQTEILSSVLTAGSLPTSLRKEPSTSLLTGPTLGADTIRKGINSMVVSTIAVVAFMIVYYRFAGIVANLALLLNVALILAAMILLNAAFTLSGLAGLALTVGMAVDANVLIYERIREERARGAALRMAIRNGFGRATTTIVDANVTTLISAVVLFIIGTDQVKGFAVTLILGILMNLYTAIFVSRVIFDIAEKTRFITDLKMLHILSNPNFDFIGKRRIAMAVSLAIIAVGMAGVVERGRGLLDIDFTGGVSVEAEFVSPVDIAEVRRTIDEHKEDLPDATVQDVQITDEEPGKRYMINTSNPDVDAVKARLAEIFHGQLITNELSLGELAAIPAAATPPASETPAEPPRTPAIEPADTPGGASRRPPRTLEMEPTLLALAGAQDEPATEPTPEPGSEPAPQDPAASDAPSQPAAEIPSSTETPAADEQKPAEPQPDAGTPAETQPAETSPAPGQPSPPTAPTATESPSTAPAGPAAGPDAPASAAPGDAGEKADEKAAEDAIAAAADRFAGGTQVVLTFSTPIGHGQVSRLLDEAYERVTSGRGGVFIYELSAPGYEFGSAANFPEWTLKTVLDVDQTRKVLANVQTELEDQPYFASASEIGATVASNTQNQAAVALIASLALILAYVWFRFSQVMFGVAAVVAVIHDVLVALGFLALSAWLARLGFLDFLLIEPFKISLPIIAAFLTIIGYSLNDTIVIFDRIREVRGKSPLITPEMANRCINQTLSRTILTSLTVFIVVVILYAMGGQGIHGFAFVLVVGVVAGTFSTIYIATPIVLWMNRGAASSTSSRVLKAEAVAQGTST